MAELEQGVIDETKGHRKPAYEEDETEQEDEAATPRWRLWLYRVCRIGTCSQTYPELEDGQELGERDALLAILHAEGARQREQQLKVATYVGGFQTLLVTVGSGRGWHASLLVCVISFWLARIAAVMIEYSHHRYYGVRQHIFALSPWLRRQHERFDDRAESERGEADNDEYLRLFQSIPWIVFLATVVIAFAKNTGSG